MIERLKLQNFQPHKNLTVDFDIGITSIIGSSDRGKTALMRALKWVCTNRPGGFEFITYGEDQVQATLDVSGQRLTRTKSKKKNTYAINGGTLSAVKTDVPEQVQSILNMDSINFQSQHDSPFWFCETAGEVSRQLNRIVSLDILDTTLASIQKQHRAASAEMGVLEDQLVADTADIKALKPWKRVHKDLQTLEALGDKVTKTARKCAVLDDMVQGVAQYRSGCVRQRKALFLAKKRVLLFEEALSKTKQAQELDNLLKNTKKQHAITQKPLPDMYELESLASTHTQYTQLRDLIQGPDGITTWEQKLSKRKQAHQKQAAQLKRKLKGKCPLCGNKIKS